VTVTALDSLLVANRGEIARRVLRTASAMGLRTVAVYSEPDRNAPHVGAADVAVAVGGSTASESYLDIAKVLAAAEATGARGVHPGYGFLSENAAAAEAVEQAGLLWIGPRADVIRQMGDKVTAKRVAVAVGVPVLNSVELVGDADFEWQRQVGAVGFPLLVKAAAGGGGKGMRMVTAVDQLGDAVRAGRREADASFGDPTVFAERWLGAARHVEIQVIADRHGTVGHLGERECSIQRRHQKIVEEAPSPAVDAALRTRMGDAAVAIARAIGYDSVGTVEFLLDAETDEFWFLEMNTRLQVEHPVTEAVTGYDLVRLQIEAATGVPLDLDRLDPTPKGHAIEARVYAEDPAHDWTPSTGELHHWSEPSGVRVDAGVVTGSVVSPFYDPMLAKVVAHAPTRTEAAGQLAAALRRLMVHGVVTNRDHLVAVLSDDDFLAGRTTTTFVDDHPDLLARRPGQATRTAHALAAVLLGQHHRRSADPHWSAAPSGWRNGRRLSQRVSLVDDEGSIEVAYSVVGERLEATVGDRSLNGRILEVGDHRIQLELGGVALTCDVHTVDTTTWVNSPAGQTEMTELARFPHETVAVAAAGPTAPTPGRVVSVEVRAGERVSIGDTLVVLEAMKVEHRIVAAVDATVAEVLVEVGDNVDAHALLVRLEET
jgi:propionyl-CoA carboxylase alpha chain